MRRKLIGMILLTAGGALAMVLFINGRLIFPHVIGPAALAMIGVILLAIKTKTDKSTE